MAPRVGAAPSRFPADHALGERVALERPPAGGDAEAATVRHVHAAVFDLERILGNERIGPGRPQYEHKLGAAESAFGRNAGAVMRSIISDGLYELRIGC